MVKEIWEDAMHRTVRETLGDTDDIKAVMAGLSASWPRPETFLPDLKRDIADFLQSAGFPPPGEVVFHKGRYWCHKLEGELPIGMKSSPGWAFIQKQSEPLTPHHEAASLFLKAIEVEGALRCGEIDRVFSHSLLLGIAHNRFKMRWLHLKNVARGKKVAGGQLNAAHKTNERHVPLRQKRFARMTELVPSLGVENAARQCEAEGLGGWQAVRRQWDRFKEKPDT